MDEKLETIFTFLNANRQFNHAFQERFYKSIIMPFADNRDKVVALLYHIANTQSQPKIDNLAHFFKSIFQGANCFSSFTNFIGKINPYSPINFHSLYNGMKNQNGWGKKTAALFTKSIYHLHNGYYSDKIKIWNDVPTIIANDDKFYLPVDSVIIAIFKKLNGSIRWDFDKINNTLLAKYNGQHIEVWDDLWFWGFITQNGSGDERLFNWNENKYWVLKESDKDLMVIQQIRNKSGEFLQTLK